MTPLVLILIIICIILLGGVIYLYTTNRRSRDADKERILNLRKKVHSLRDEKLKLESNIRKFESHATAGNNVLISTIKEVDNIIIELDKSIVEMTRKNQFTELENKISNEASSNEDIKHSPKNPTEDNPTKDDILSRKAELEKKIQEINRQQANNSTPKNPSSVATPWANYKDSLKKKKNSSTQENKIYQKNSPKSLTSTNKIPVTAQN